MMKLLSTRLERPIASPFAVQIDRNKFISRWVIETLGYYPFSLAVARNTDERLEIGLDWGMWGMMGVALPYVLDRFLSRRMSRRIRQRFGIPPAPDKVLLKHSLLTLPFEWLSSNQHHLPGAEDVSNLAKALSLESAKALETSLQNPAFRRAVLHSKLGIMALGLTLMAAKGQLYSWLKNWITERRSGKKGFSGVFNYTDAHYREKASANYYRDRQKRMALSIGCGLMASLGFPLFVMGVAKGWPGLKRLQGILPRLNYTDGIFMPKEVFVVHTLFNYNLPTLMACRDRHEFREKLSRCLAFDFFYYLGDDIIAGQVAKALEKSWPLIRPISKMKRGFLGLPFRHAEPLEKVFLQQVQDAGAAYRHDPRYKAAWYAWLSGLLGSAFGLGLAIPILNNAYTYQAVQHSQGFNHPKLRKRDIFLRFQTEWPHP